MDKTLEVYSSEFERGCPYCDVSKAKMNQVKTMARVMDTFIARLENLITPTEREIINRDETLRYGLDEAEADE